MMKIQEKKIYFLDKEGKNFFDALYNSQKKRIFNALKIQVQTLL